MADLVDADKLLLPVVQEAITRLSLPAEHLPAAKLAERYAATIDGALGEEKKYAWAIRWTGPLLLDALQAIGAVPAVTKSQPAETKPGGRLAVLRSQHAG